MIIENIHGSVEIYRRFLKDRDLCEGFAYFLSRKDFNEEDEKLSTFANYYGRLLYHSYEFFFLSYLPENELCVHLVPHPDLAEMSKATLIASTKHKLAMQALRELAPLYNLSAIKSKLSDEKRINLENAIAELLRIEIDEVAWEIPETWIPIRAIEKVLYKEMLAGRWPTFVLEPKPTLSGHNLSCFTYAWPIVGADKLVAQYLHEAASIYSRMCQIVHGRLPIGLKIHSLGKGLLDKEVFWKGAFKLESASTCAVLPPVGNISAVRELLGLLEKETGLSFLDNPLFQIQVCSPGELTPQNAALLGICFYLGSDKLRKYTPGDFITTRKETGARLIVYGAGRLDKNFEWWGKDDAGKIRKEKMPAAVENRTNVLTCRSLKDIDNVNLVATLLMHAQIGGYWESLGKQFVSEMEKLLARHQLSGLINVSWVYGAKQQDKSSDFPGDKDGSLFFDVFSELIEYAFAEVRRIQEAARRVDRSAAYSGILFEVQELLNSYREELEVRSPKTGTEDI